VPSVIDLHAHTTASDGDDRPAELIQQALTAGIDVLALTDHDTMSGLREAADAVAGSGMLLLPGIELSAQVIDEEPGSIPRSVHLLGYGVDPENVVLAQEMETIRSHRDDRLRLMVEKLAVDFELTWQEVSDAIAPGATPGRPHIAQVLINKGYFSDTSAAFAGPLRAEGPYHVPHYAPRLHRAVRVIAEAGGVPVLAHPFTDARSGAIRHDQPLERVLEGYRVFVEAGLAGLEIDHRENSEEGKEVLRAVAAEFSLIVTGSSDYHGTRKPNQLGENQTDPSQLERILEAATGLAPIS
jgi:predicted metal-dependent phosphoesterase TrpH